MKELISVTATKKKDATKKKVWTQNFFVLNVSSIFIMEIRETTQETFKNFLREWMFHRWRSTFVVKKKDFLEMMDLCFFFTTWHAFWWITQIFRCIRKVNIYFFYLLCFGLCTNIQQRYCYVRKRQYVCMFFWQSINACDDIFSARRKIFIADIERRWRTFF